MSATDEVVTTNVTDSNSPAWNLNFESAHPRSSMAESADATSAVVVQLRRIVESRAGVHDDPRLVEAFLNDLAGGYRHEISLIVTAANDKVPAKLLAVDGAAAPAEVCQQLAERLRRSARLSTAEAHWAVSAWAAALEIPGFELSPGAHVAAAQLELLGYATAAAKSITHPRHRARALSGIAEATARMNLDRATQVVDAIDSLYWKVTALCGIIRVMQETRSHRVIQLLEETEQFARAIAVEAPFHESLTRALLNLATVAAASNYARATRLFDEAELLASAAQDSAEKWWLLGQIAEGLATYNPDRAERLARALYWDHSKVQMFVRIASCVADVEPDRASRLLDEAERTAYAITDDRSKACSLAVIAAARSAAGARELYRLFDDAERTARSITDEAMKGEALGQVCKALAGHDVDRALLLVGSISSYKDREAALRDVVVTIASADWHRALRLVGCFADDNARSDALVAAVEAMRAADTDQPEHALELALRYAWAVTADYPKSLSLIATANAFYASNSERAVRLLADALRIAGTLTENSKATVLIRLAQSCCGPLDI